MTTTEMNTAIGSDVPLSYVNVIDHTLAMMNSCVRLSFGFAALNEQMLRFRASGN